MSIITSGPKEDEELTVKRETLASVSEPFANAGPLVSDCTVQMVNSFYLPLSFLRPS